MSKDLSLALTINVDKKEGESNLHAFERAFTDALDNIGKSAEETIALRQLFKEIQEGKQKVSELDTETQKLYETYKEGAAVAADRDFLGLRAHSDVQKEMDATREAYQRLKDSGELTQAELAQAALKTEDRIRELRRETDGWADSVMNAKGSMLALAGSVGGMAKIVGTAIDFEAAMSDVKKVVTGTDEEIAGLTTRIKEMSGELPISAEGLAEIAAAGGRLGVPIQKLEQFVELSAKMSVAFNLSVGEAGEAVAKLSNIFDIPIENIEELGDAINTLGNTTAAKESDILNVLTRIGGTAKNFKLTAEQAAVLSATMLEMGSSSEKAGTAINAVLSRLQTASVQSPQFQQALEGMGLSATKLADDIRENPQKALHEFLTTLKQLDDKTRAEALTQLFGREYQSQVALLVNGLDKYEASLGRVADKNTVAGAMQDEFNERMQTTETQLQLMQNGVKAIAINLGSIFLPALRESAIYLGDVTQAIAGFIEAHSGIAQIATTLTLVATSAGALRLVLLSLRAVGIKSFSSIRTEVNLTKLSMGELTKSVGVLGATIRTVGGVWAAWEIGTDIGDALYDNFEIARKAGNKLAQSMTLLMETAGAAWKALKNPGNIGEVWDEYTASVKRVNETYAEMYDEIGTATDVAAKGISKVSDAAAAAGESAKEAAKQALEATERINGIDFTAKTGIQEFTKLIDEAAGNTSELQKKFNEWVDNANAVDLTSFQEGIKAAYADGKMTVEDFAIYTNAVLWRSFEEVGVNAKAALGGIGDEAKNAIDSIDLIRDSLMWVGADGAKSMLALEQAIAGAISKADGSGAVEVLSDRIESMGAAGELSASQVERLSRKLQEQKEVINESVPGIQSVEEAMRRLGVTSQSELARVAANSREAFEAVRSLGGGLEDQQTAFTAYAKTAIAATENLTDSQRRAVIEQLKVTATTMGMREQLEQLLDVQQNVADKGEGVGRQVKDGAEEGAKGMETLKQAAEDTAATAGSAGAALANIFNATRQSMLDLSEAAAALFDTRMGISTAGPVTEIDALKNSINATNQALGETRLRSARAFDVTGVNAYLNKMSEAAQSTRVQFQQQQLEALKLTQRLQDAGTATAGTIAGAQAAINRMGLLGQEDLSQLRSALDSANSKLKAMNDNAKSTLDGLKNELDRLQDNQTAIDNRDYQNKRAQLESALQEARQMRNQEAIGYYTDALKTLDAVRNEKKKQAAESAAEKVRAQRQAAEKSKPNNSVGIELKLGNKKSALSAGNQSDADALIKILEEAGLTAL